MTADSRGSTGTRGSCGTVDRFEDGYEDGSPAREVLDRIGDRWTIAIMRVLEECGSLRYTELEHCLPGVSRKMLTQILRAIERDGMVIRTVHPEIPPRVEYALTPLGRSALRPIDVLCAWSAEHMREVRAARHAYDAEHGQSRRQEPALARAQHATR